MDGLMLMSDWGHCDCFYDQIGNAEAVALFKTSCHTPASLAPFFSTYPFSCFCIWLWGPAHSSHLL